MKRFGVVSRIPIHQGGTFSRADEFLEKPFWHGFLVNPNTYVMHSQTGLDGEGTT